MYRRRGLAKRVHAYPVKVCGTNHETKKNRVLQIRYVKDGVSQLQIGRKGIKSSQRWPSACALAVAAAGAHHDEARREEG